MEKNVTLVQAVIASVTFWLAASHFVALDVSLRPSVTFFHDHEARGKPPAWVAGACAISGATILLTGGKRCVIDAN